MREHSALANAGFYHQLRHSSQRRAYSGCFFVMMPLTPLFIKQMPRWLFWISYLNPVYYSFEALMINEFNGLNLRCVDSNITPRGAGYPATGELAAYQSDSGTECSLNALFLQWAPTKSALCQALEADYRLSMDWSTSMLPLVTSEALYGESLVFLALQNNDAIFLLTSQTHFAKGEWDCLVPLRVSRQWQLTHPSVLFLTVELWRRRHLLLWFHVDYLHVRRAHAAGCLFLRVHRSKETKQRGEAAR